MSPRAEPRRERSLLRKLERILAWTMSGLAVALAICYFVLVGLQLPVLDQPFWGTQLNLGTALGFACLATFGIMILIFTFLSDKIGRNDRKGPSGS